MKLTLLAACGVGLQVVLSGCTAHQNTDAATAELLVLPVQPPGQPGGLPAAWEPYQFEKIPRQTHYAVDFNQGRPALRARAESSASALRRQVSIDPAATPIIEWTWNIEHALDGANLGAKAGDDCAARLLLVYESLPNRVLVYVWAGERETNAILTSPYSSRIRLIPVRRGPDGTGQWQSERRNHRDDYRQAFHSEPPRIQYVAWMTDTDNAGGEATAYFGSLRFQAR